MTALEIIIRGSCYRSGGIDPVAQITIARNLLPMLDAIVPSLKSQAAGKPIVGGNKSMADLIEKAAVFLQYLGQMPQELQDFLLNACLTKVERQRPNGTWERIWSDKRGAVAVEGMTGADLVEIAAKVLMVEMGDFATSIMERIPAAVGVMPRRHMNG